MPELRDLERADLPRIQFLNDGAEPHVPAVPPEQMLWYAEKAAYFKVVMLDERLAAFLVGLSPDVDYDSPNFRWFRERRPSFVYIDRVVVAPEARRRGIARQLYEDLERFATRSSVPLLTCEVNVRPPNPGSLTFHRSLGFVEVGRQQTAGGRKEVVLLEKRLVML